MKTEKSELKPNGWNIKFKRTKTKNSQKIERKN